MDTNKESPPARRDQGRAVSTQGEAVTGAAARNIPQGRTGSVVLPNMTWELRWSAHDDDRGPGASVSFYNGQQKLAELEVRENSPQSFALPSGVQFPSAEGTLELRLGPRVQLVGQIKTSKGGRHQGPIAEWELVDPRPGPTPPPQPPPPPLMGEPENSGVVLQSTADIFHLVEPTVPGEVPLAARSRFIFCAEPSSLELYQQLAGCQGELAKMSPLAATFMQGQDYVRSLDSLPGPGAKLAEVARKLQSRRGTCEPEELLKLAQEALGEKPADYVGTDAYTQARRRLWQSIMAFTLAGTPGAPEAALLMPALRALELLERLTKEPETLAREEHRREALSARAVLPSGATPLPSTAQSSGQGYSTLLGIGSLKVIRQRLARYELGEIAFTVNLMPRESRSLTQRALSRATDSGRVTVAEEQGTRNESREARRSELADELNDLAAQEASFRCWDIDKKYPSDGVDGTDKGQAACTRSPRADSRRSTGDFAQHLTRLAMARLGRRISEERSQRLLEEQERVERSEIDNSTRESRELGIYRWLVKVFSLELAERGRRLVVELMLPEPAAKYLDTLRLEPVPLAEPEALGLQEPKDLDAANYREYAARYGVTGLTPPPEQTLSVQATLRRESSVTMGTLTVPPGYRVTAGQVSWAISDQAYTLTGLIGQLSFTSQKAAPAAGASTATKAGDSGDCDCKNPITPPVIPAPASGSKLFQDVSGIGKLEGEIPIGALCGADGFAVIVSLTCTLEAGLLEAWQRRTYDALVAAYNARLEEYQAAFQARLDASSRDRYRELEQEQLKEGSLSLLWQRRAEAPPDPIYLRFFERLGEWREMAYRFYSWGVGDPVAPHHPWRQSLLEPDSDQLFQSFLRAGSARVLLPIVPGQELEAIYYFLFGTLPPWSEAALPVPESYVDELVALSAAQGDTREKHWREEIPTSLVLLQQGETLPEFKG
ncbi:hypothetical protein NR798_35975 [Archangium gephyra]|uniref:hypothetical protein n=1 Tax=Archangium gephyra TaxID=48 RepID=UPI0035D4C0D8